MQIMRRSLDSRLHLLITTSLTPNITPECWQETQPRKTFQVSQPFLFYWCSSVNAVQMQNIFFRIEEMNGAGPKGKETLINKLGFFYISSHANLLLFVILALQKKSDSWCHEKEESCCLGVCRGSKLDRDLANQNSLQKLCDPGGLRALDKQH